MRFRRFAIGLLAAIPAAAVAALAVSLLPPDDGLAAGFIGGVYVTYSLFYAMGLLERRQ